MAFLVLVVAVVVEAAVEEVGSDSCCGVSISFSGGGI